MVAGVISRTDIGLGTKQNKEGGPDGAAGGDHGCPSKPQSEPWGPKSQNEKRNGKSEQKGRICMKVWPKRLFIGGKHGKQKIKYLFVGVRFVLFSRDSSEASLKLWFSPTWFPSRWDHRPVLLCLAELTRSKLVSSRAELTLGMA